MAESFGMILRNRRRNMGLSIQQVSNIIKIRPQIIEIFENSDFPHMPPRGYAQGMISSYARFLQLNPNDIVNQFYDELCRYEQDGMPTRFNGDPNIVAHTRSDTSHNRFMIVDGGRAVSSPSRYGSRPPQAGYVTETAPQEEIRRSRNRVRSASSPYQGSVPPSRGLSGDPRSGYGDGSNRARTARLAAGRDQFGSNSANRSRNAYGSSGSARSQGQTARADRQGTSRSRVRAGRNGSQRNSGARRNSNVRPGQASIKHDGIIGILATFDKRLVVGVAVAFALVIVLLFMSLVRSCTKPAPTSTVEQAMESVDSSKAKKSSNKKTASKKKQKAASVSSDSADDVADDLDSDSTDAGAAHVKVVLAKKKTAFIEIRVDGKLVYGAQATGPFTKEYDPMSSIEITTSKPNYVTVYNNGKKVRYETKTSGVARVSITVAKKAKSANDTSSSSDGSGSGSDSSSDSESSSDGSSSSDLATDSSESSSGSSVYSDSYDGTTTE